MSATGLLASAPVTNWPERLLLTGLVALAVVAVLALMRVGWVRRGRRQQDIAPLPPVLPLPEQGLALSAVQSRYLGTTRGDDWLDRVVVRGLGVPSAAQVSVGAEGLWCLRTGAPDLFIPAGQLVDARHDRGHAGKVYEGGGVLVLRWRHEGVTLETGLRVRDAAVAEELRRSATGVSR